MGKGILEGYSGHHRPPPPPPHAMRAWLLAPPAASGEHRCTPLCLKPAHTQRLYQLHEHHPSSGTRTLLWVGGREVRGSASFLLGA